MKGHRIKVLCFPPHCTHLMQPLNNVPFGALKKAYQNEILEYNLRKVSKVDFFRILVPAYTRAMTEKTIKAGFEHTGIYPVNPLVPKLLRTWPSLVNENLSKLQPRHPNKNKNKSNVNPKQYTSSETL